MAWQKVATETLGIAGDTITASSITDLEFYVVLTHILPSGNFRETMRINNVSSTDYAQRDSEDGGTDATKVSRPILEFGKKDEATDAFSVGYWINAAAEEKLCMIWEVRANTAGATNAPSRNENVGKFDNSSAINRFDVLNDQGGDFATDSNLSVLGTD